MNYKTRKFTIVMDLVDAETDRITCEKLFTAIESLVNTGNYNKGLAGLSVVEEILKEVK